jgi:uncharacterized protein
MAAISSGMVAISSFIGVVERSAPEVDKEARVYYRSEYRSPPLLNKPCRINNHIVRVNTMNEMGAGDARRRHRGRPRVTRSIEGVAPMRCYAPQCSPHEGGENVRILPEELELLRLVDLEGLEQEEAATMLGVSRKTVWRDLHEARRKLADALLHGKGIEVAGCVRKDSERCPKKRGIVCPKWGAEQCPRWNLDDPMNGTAPGSTDDK